MNPLIIPAVLGGMGLLSSATSPGDAPKNQTVPLDMSTQNAIKEQASGIEQTADFYGNRSNLGVDQAASGLISDGPESGTPGINSAAIKNRYKKILGSEVARLKKSNMMSGHQQKYDQLQKIQSVLNARNGLQAQAYERMAQMRAAEDAAKSSFLSSIGSLAGTFGGYALAGATRKSGGKDE